MKTIDIDAEIQKVKEQVAFWQGKLELLLALKGAGAVVQVPQSQDDLKPEQPVTEMPLQ